MRVLLTAVQRLYRDMIHFVMPLVSTIPNQISAMARLSGLDDRVLVLLTFAFANEHAVKFTNVVCYH